MLCLLLSPLQTAALSGDGRHLTYLGQKAVYDGLMYVINNNLRSIRCVKIWIKKTLLFILQTSLQTQVEEEVNWDRKRCMA